jgi:hypothetical protein
MTQSLKILNKLVRKHLALIIANEQLPKPN